MGVKKRVYEQPAGPHPVGVYASRWSTGRWWVQVSVPRSKRSTHALDKRAVYLGVVDSPEHGAALVKEFKKKMGMDLAERPAPIERPQQRW